MPVPYFWEVTSTYKSITFLPDPHCARNKCPTFLGSAHLLPKQPPSLHQWISEGVGAGNKARGERKDGGMKDKSMEAKRRRGQQLAGAGLGLTSSVYKGPGEERRR